MSRGKDGEMVKREDVAVVRGEGLGGLWVTQRGVTGCRRRFQGGEAGNDYSQLLTTLSW